jgi:hypothetical protein
MSWSRPLGGIPTAMIGTKAGKSVGKVEIPEGPLEAAGMV